MKIGALEQHCGKCAVADYCADPFEDLCLCCDSRLEDLEEEEYIKLAETSRKSTNEEICEDVVIRSGS